ncbi:TerC family protein [Azorhizobium doebereinerae]|uniref:TerC family protein n=1 Tax=Azorhizobium doebereinerae TaxID=281091 RepID=UPI000413963E|nr:TerC family protein [Azorhizobium doebereinerae]
MDFDSPTFWLSLLQIIWIDLLLSGDNAVVIALACRSLPPGQRRWGILLGAGAAVGLRIVFALAISYLLGVPLLKIAGGLLLLWIAVKLVLTEEESAHTIAAADSLWRAVRTIAIADAVMSLDNVVAIAAASRGHPELFIFGLLLTIPLIVAGSQLVLALLQRLPALVWAGAALLGFIAGEMLVSDVVSVDLLRGIDPHWVKADEEAPGGVGPAKLPHYVAGGLGALFVLAFGFALRGRRMAAHNA